MVGIFIDPTQLSFRILIFIMMMIVYRSSPIVPTLYFRIWSALALTAFRLAHLASILEKLILLVSLICKIGE
jgi:hypothetical protein